jgi:hypothetical protein
MSLVVSIVPFAIGAATNPAALAIELLILSGANRAKARTWAYLFGFVVGLLIFTTIAFLLLGRMSDAGSGQPSVASRIISAVIAVALLALGIKTLIPKKGPKKPSKFAARIAAAKTPAFFGIGLLAMITDASSMILLLPALHEISLANDVVGVKFLATAVLLLIMLLPLVLPVLAVTVLRHRADSVLAKVNGFVSRHQSTINGIVIIVIALLVGYKAI